MGVPDPCRSRGGTATGEWAAPPTIKIRRLKQDPVHLGAKTIATGAEGGSTSPAKKTKVEPAPSGGKRRRHRGVPASDQTPLSIERIGFPGKEWTARSQRKGGGHQLRETSGYEKWWNV